MRTPKRRGTSISNGRIADWVSYFSCYRKSPTGADFEAWIDRFSSTHRDIAARILDCAEILSETDILRGYKDILESLPGWARARRNRHGEWYFVGFGRAGESGAEMLRKFREANGLSSGQYNCLFKGSADLPSLALTARDTVVFIDDFSGSGKQVTTHWPTVKELVASHAKTYLILTACTETARKKIEDETDTELKVSRLLREEDNVFSQSCRHFNSEEEKAIVKYGKKAKSGDPKGFGKCGLLFVLSHKTPNNSLPILHANKEHWVGPFPRYLLPA